MKINNILRKIKQFITKNAYALTVCFCVVLALTMIGVASLSVNSGSNNVVEDIPTNNPEPPADDVLTGSDDIISFVLPIKDGEIYKEYAENHLLEDKTTGFWQAHLALDFKAKEGDNVLSVYDGTVEKVENSMMDGLVVTIKHSDTLKSVYKCLADEAIVKVGDKVSSGQEIGKVSTNLTEKADGIHLHFELYENDKLVDPTPYFSMGK